MNILIKPITRELESLLAQIKPKNIHNEISFGYGAEYKYDWGNYKTLTFTSQTKGHLKNLGIFANSGYKFNDNQSLSLHVRNDDHKETGGNQTYKINFTQLIQNLKINY